MGWNIPYLNPADVKGFRGPQKLGHISPQMGIIYPSQKAAKTEAVSRRPAGTTGGGGMGFSDKPKQTVR